MKMNALRMPATSAADTAKYSACRFARPSTKSPARTTLYCACDLVVVKLATAEISEQRALSPPVHRQLWRDEVERSTAAVYVVAGRESAADDRRAHRTMPRVPAQRTSRQ